MDQLLIIDPYWLVKKVVKLGNSSESANMQAFLLLVPLLLILAFKVSTYLRIYQIFSMGSLAKVNDGHTARHYLVEMEVTPEKRWKEKTRRGKGGNKVNAFGSYSKRIA